MRTVESSRTAASRRPNGPASLALRSWRKLRFAGRQLTRSRRVLPDFLILGAQKAGTTSLYSYLQMHPRIEPAFTKEVHYFTKHLQQPEAWYRAHFPRAAALAKHSALTGEATPYYLFEPRVPARVASLLPDARFVVLLRNPVERAYSHYQHERARGREPLGFAAALECEEERLAPELQRLLADPLATSSGYQNHSYFARGLYAEQLLRWREHFSADRFLCIQSEAFFADPAATCQRVFEFLGLPHHTLTGLRIANQRSYAPLDPPLRAELRARYAPHERALEELLGVRYDWR